MVWLRSHYTLYIASIFIYSNFLYFVALSTTRHSCGLIHCVHWRFFFFFLSLFSKSRPIRIRWYICPFAQRLYSHDDGSFAQTFFALGLLAWLLASRDLSLFLCRRHRHADRAESQGAALTLHIYIYNTYSSIIHTF